MTIEKFRAAQHVQGNRVSDMRFRQEAGCCKKTTDRHSYKMAVVYTDYNFPIRLYWHNVTLKTSQAGVY